MKEIVLDTETTGLSVENGHRIIEIGCIELEDQILTSNRFHCYLNPQRKVSEEAFKVHGYSDEFLSDKKKFHEIADDFLKFIDGTKLIIHNAQFDLSHLNNELKLLGKKQILKDQVIDTLDLAREKFPGSQISLDALCKRFRIDNWVLAVIESPKASNGRGFNRGLMFSSDGCLIASVSQEGLMRLRE